MKELIAFCMEILKKIVACYNGLNLGGYSFGTFLVATSVVSILIGTLIVSFRASGGSPGQVVKPPRSNGITKSKPS